MKPIYRMEFTNSIYDIDLTKVSIFYFIKKEEKLIIHIFGEKEEIEISPVKQDVYNNLIKCWMSI